MFRRDQSGNCQPGLIYFQSVQSSWRRNCIACIILAPSGFVPGRIVVEAPVVNRHVVFSHGQESGPWGRQIYALADVARSEGYESHSVDYRGIDEPRARVAKLVDFCKELSGDLVLGGSSMGPIAGVASASLLHARGVFLMAPALYMEG